MEGGGRGALESVSGMVTGCNAEPVHRSKPMKSTDTEAARLPLASLTPVWRAEAAPGL